MIKVESMDKKDESSLLWASKVASTMDERLFKFYSSFLDNLLERQVEQEQLPDCHRSI